MRFERYSVVRVPFPFTDQSAAKKRPGVVISAAAYQRERPDLIIMAVTSQIKPAQTMGEVFVKDWQGAGLLKPSVIKPVIATIEKPLVIKTLGRLKDDDQATLRSVISKILG